MLAKLLPERQSAEVRARGGTPRAVPVRAIRASIAIILLIPQLTGCFQSVPAGHSPIPAGAELTVGVTDRGRVALAESVGPGVRRISGRLLESTDTSLVLSVNTVEFLDLGLPVRWAGERVHVSRVHVADIRERRFSPARTVIMAGVVAAAAVAISFIAIKGLGADPAPDRPPTDRDPD